jgi:hypothetical protein
MVVLVVAVLLVAMIPAQAQTVGFRSVTLMGFQEHQKMQAGVILDLHLIKPPTKTDKWYLKVQDIVARHSAFSWAQTGTTVGNMTDISNGSPGISLLVKAQEADINGGLIWKKDDHHWYWHISFAIK